ncbi:WYL domain-containing protein [Cetobacterium ceti]|uniref:WYL domain-containing protein n=1 Tax=Cetobacterium ceti TaxID=180163 RepID=A0A1T4P429_9FUSO|nr:WYL domain-containing protein [Cetobacterium ceti]SJZ86264.1 WYL domain-containing protein [Cetobacterium ceti]
MTIIMKDKVRVTLPEEIVEILLGEQQEYKIKPNKYYNLIFKNFDFSFRLKENDSIYSKKTKLIQFTLNKGNYIKYDTKENLQYAKATYFRELFTEYSSLSSVKREMILFKEKIEVIESAIKNKIKVHIISKGRLEIIEPYFIKNLEKENRNYITCYSYIKKKVITLRISNIETIKSVGGEFEHYDEKHVKNLENNFDPFLSYGNIVKVKFSEDGLKRYKTIITNRPKLLKKENGNIYYFQANEYSFFLYFSGFLDLVEILEPIEFRKKMIDKIKHLLNIYNLK